MTETQVIEASPHECWIAGSAEPGQDSFPVTHPYDDTEVATVWEPGRAQVERAVTAARAGQAELTPAVRAAVLLRLADALSERREEAAELLTAESGTPITAAGAEVARSVAAIRAAARETGGYESGFRGHAPAWVRRRPRGPVLATTRAAHPVEYAAHAVAAALAAGAPVVLVPAPATPLSALLLGELLAGTELPAGWFSVLPLREPPSPDAVGGLVPAVYGAEYDSTLLVCADWGAADDLEFAAYCVAMGCDRRTAPPGTATTRVVVDASCYEDLLPRLSSAFGDRPTGSPHDPSVAIGPLPDEQAATVVTERIDAALDAGYRMVAGGGRDGASLQPTVLTARAAGLGPWREDIPGPVVLVASASGLTEALGAVDDLGPERAVSLLTHDLRTARGASENLRSGVITVGRPGSSTWDVSAAVRALTRETVTVFPNG